MTDIEIQKDIDSRTMDCIKEIDAICQKYLLIMSAFHDGNDFKLSVPIKFINQKTFPKADLAQSENRVATHLASVTPVAPVLLPEGVQPDGSVVINKDSLN